MTQCVIRPKTLIIPEIKAKKSLLFREVAKIILKYDCGFKEKEAQLCDTA